MVHVTKSDLSFHVAGTYRIASLRLLRSAATTEEDVHAHIGNTDWLVISRHLHTAPNFYHIVANSENDDALEEEGSDREQR